VSYTAVVEVENRDGKLLPGMTATVDFLTGSAANVLTVPNSALRFRPTEQMMAELRASSGAPAGGDSARAGARRRAAGASGGSQGAARSGSTRPANSGRLWVLKDGKLSTVRVRTGITDGTKTEVSGEGLADGAQVIVGTTQAAAGASGAATGSPFGGAQGQGGAPRGPGGF